MDSMFLSSLAAVFSVPPIASLFLAASGNPVPSWLQYIQSGGVIGMFILLSYALLSRRMVMGWTYDAMVEERDFYREIAHRTTDIADRQVTAAEEMLRRMDRLTLRGDVLEARNRAQDP